MSTQKRTSPPSRGRRVQKRSNQRTMFVLGGIALMAVIMIASVALVGRQATNSAASSATLPVSISSEPAPAGAEPNGRAWGPKDAPITVIEYADYECESCGFFAKNYERDFVAAFANTSKVRFEIRNAPFHGEGARNAAEAAYCAAEQNMFWPLHNSIFVNQPVQEGTGAQAFSDARLTAIATKLKMDTTAFGSCLSSGKYTQQVAGDYNATVAAGITGTPTFIVNGKPYVGPQSVDDFRRIFAEVAPDVTFGS